MTAEEELLELPVAEAIEEQVEHPETTALSKELLETCERCFNPVYVTEGCKSGKKDLIQRLQEIASALSTIDTDELSSISVVPHIEGLRDCFKHYNFFNSEIEEIQLLTACCLVDLFRVWVVTEQPPYSDEDDLAQCFDLFHSALKNANFKQSKNPQKFTHQYHLLEILTKYQMLAILVPDSTGEDEDDSEQFGTDILIKILRNLVQCVDNDTEHNALVYIKTVLKDILEEFDEDAIPLNLLNALFRFLLKAYKHKHEASHNLVKNVITDTKKILVPRVNDFIKKYLLTQPQRRNRFRRSEAFQIVAELGKINEDFLQESYWRLQGKLEATDVKERIEYIDFFAELFTAKFAGTKSKATLDLLFRRFKDKETQVRMHLLKKAPELFTAQLESQNKILDLIGERFEDGSHHVRLEALKSFAMIVNLEPHVAGRQVFTKFRERIRDKNVNITRYVAQELARMIQKFVQPSWKTGKDVSPRSKPFVEAIGSFLKNTLEAEFMSSLLDDFILGGRDCTLEERTNIMIFLFGSLEEAQRSHLVFRFFKRKQRIVQVMRSLCKAKINLNKEEEDPEKAERAKRELNGWIKYVAVELQWSPHLHDRSLDVETEHFVQILIQQKDTAYLQNLLTLCHGEATWDQICNAREKLTDLWRNKPNKHLLERLSHRLSQFLLPADGVVKALRLTVEAVEKLDGDNAGMSELGWGFPIAALDLLENFADYFSSTLSIPACWRPLINLLNHTNPDVQQRALTVLSKVLNSKACEFVSEKEEQFKELCLRGQGLEIQSQAAATCIAKAYDKIESKKARIVEIVKYIWSHCDAEKFETEHQQLAIHFASLRIFCKLFPELVQKSIGDEMKGMICNTLLKRAKARSRDRVIVKGLHLLTDYIIALAKETGNYIEGRIFLKSCLCRQIELYQTEFQVGGNDLLIGVVECVIEMLTVKQFADSIPSEIFFYLAQLSQAENTDLRTPILNYLGEKLLSSKVPHQYSAIISLTGCDPDRTLRQTMQHRLHKLVVLHRQNNDTLKKFGLPITANEHPEMGLAYLIFILALCDKSFKHDDQKKILAVFIDAIMKMQVSETVDLLYKIIYDLKGHELAYQVEKSSRIIKLCETVEVLLSAKTHVKGRRSVEMKAFESPVSLNRNYFRRKRKLDTEDELSHPAKRAKSEIHEEEYLEEE